METLVFHHEITFGTTSFETEQGVFLTSEISTEFQFSINTVFRLQFRILESVIVLHEAEIPTILLIPCLALNTTKVGWDTKSKLGHL